MPARAISSATVSFGLVSIPIKLYSASESGTSIHFNMVHAECGTRVKQQYYCPTHDRVVERDELTRGYEFAKGQYVLIDDAEYKALQEVASNTLELTEFVPGDQVDPIYFEKTYYVGPDKGGERAYKLLTQAMLDTGLYGIAKYAARGKMYLVLVKPHGDAGLVMHQLHYADEIKSFDEVPIKDAPEASAKELELARQIIQQIARKDFDPAEYRDEVRDRMQALIDQKVEGQDITAPTEAAPQAQIIDLMEALKQSLGMAGGGATKGAAGKTRKAGAGKAAGRSGGAAAKASKDKPSRAAGGRGKR
jgi:DNA end-binding protein Ku